MNKLNKIFFFVFCISYVLCAFSTVAYAVEVDTNYVPLTTIPGVFNERQATNPVNVLKGIYGLAIGVGSVIAVVMIIFAGFKYMYEESIFGKSGARQMIENAVYGLLLILASYIILRTINPALVEFDINLPGGSGKLQGLLALQTQIDALQTQLARGASQRGAIRTEIEKLNDRITPIQQQIDEIQKAIDEQGGENLTPEEIARQFPNETKQIADLQKQIDPINAEIATKSVALKTLETQNTAGLSRQTQFTNVALQTASAIKEKGDASAISEVSTALNRLSNDITPAQIESIQRSIEEARALPDTDANRAQISAYIASAQQSIAYLQTSKSLIDDVKSLPQTDKTANGVPAPGGGVYYTEKPKPIAERSAQFDAVISKYNQQIATYTAQNRPDLATNLRNDINSITTLMKVGAESQCGGTANASLTLCKP